MQKFPRRLDIHPDVVQRLKEYIKHKDELGKYYLESCVVFSKKLNNNKTNKEFFYLVAKVLILNGEINLLKKLFENQNRFLNLGEKKKDLILIAKQSKNNEIISILNKLI